MELWFTENHTDNVRFSIKIDRQLVNVQSKYQQIDIFDTKEFGKVFALDGYIMLTEKDEFIYHEMIVHIPMAVNPQIKNVLVIGAGDGGTIRELTKYDTIEHIDMVEIDAKVVEVCREYLPQTACKLDDPRVEITHYNLLDNTVEGLEIKQDRVFSVQYHPESAAGPEDSKYLFKKFIDNMIACKEVQ